MHAPVMRMVDHAADVIPGAADMRLMPGQKYCKAEKRQVRYGQNGRRNHEVLLLPWISIGDSFILPEDLLVAILDDKDIIEQQCRQQINGGGKKGGLRGRFEPGMLNCMQIKGLYQEQPPT